MPKPTAFPPTRLLVVGLTASALASGLRGAATLADQPFRVGESENNQQGESGQSPVESQETPARSRAELFFIDAEMADPRALWLAAPKSANVICIPAGVDSWDFMAHEAAQFRGLGAIHIVSGGEPGSLILNGTHYRANDLEAKTAQLQQLGGALTKNGDLYIYGRDDQTAGASHALLSTLAKGTGVDASFSSDSLFAKTPAKPAIHISTGRAALFVDARVEDSANLLQGLTSGTEVVYLQARQDGLGQIADYLALHPEISSVQIVAHGDAGDLWLGNTYLSESNIVSYKEELAAIGRRLRRSGDILVYACDTAAGTRGIAFVNSLAQLTGHAVAASNNRTGGQGGDWNLEVRVGDVQAPSVLSTAAEAGYSHHLSLLTVTNTADSGLGSLRNAISSATSGDTITFALPAGSTIALSSELTIAKNLTINGDLDSNGTPDIIIDAGYHSRVLTVSTGTVTLDGLIIQHGLLSGDGGAYSDPASNQLGAGITNAGSLTLKDVDVTANFATGGGGGAGVTGGDVGGGGGGGSGVAGIGGGNGGIAGTYAGLPGGNGSGGNGGSFDAVSGNPAVVNNSSTLNGRGGTSSGGGAGGNNYFSYGAGGQGGTATSAGITIGGGGGGSGWNTSGNTGGSAAGGVYNSGTLFIIGNSTITNNLGAGGGGSGGGGAGHHGGIGGQGVGGIFNSLGGTVNITAAAYSAMSGNVGASGALGGISAYGGSNSGFNSPSSISRINLGSGTISTNYVPDDAPVATTSGGTTAFTEGNNVTSTPVAVDSGFTVTDDDSATLASATVAITGNLQTSEDSLSFTNNPATMGNISASYNSGTGVLTLTSSGATATVAQWQAALRSITYTNSSNLPYTGNRTVSFTVNDGSINSSTVTKTVSVSSVDDTPVATTSGGSTAWTEGNNTTSTPVAVDSGFTVSDLDNGTLNSATVAITGNLHTGEDSLLYTNNPATMGNISGVYTAATGVLSLTSAGGTATLAQWQAALRSVNYTNSSDSPNTSTRIISFTANDGTSDGNSATKNLTVASVNDSPIVTTSGGTAAFVAGDNVSSTPIAVDSGVSISDVDSGTFASAQVSISAGFTSGEDVLSFVNNPATMGNISASYNAATGVLTLSSSGATATVAQWQAALRSITYTDTAVTPNPATRTFSFRVNDGSSYSTTVTRSASVTDTDQTPIVTTTGGSTSYLGGSAAVLVDTGITVSDLDNATQNSATVSITSGFHSGDTLGFTNGDAALYGNIGASYNAGTGVLTLTSAGGTATDAQWSSALSSVTFSASSSVTPGDRTLSFVIDDGSAASAPSTDTVAVSAGPIVTLDSGSVSFTRSSNSSVSPVAVDAGLVVSDASVPTLASGAVAITGNFHSAEDVLAFTNDGATMGNILASYNAAAGVMNFSSAGSTATLAQWQAALRSITYVDTSLSPNLSTRTVSFVVTDSSSNMSNTTSRQVTVADTAAPGVVSVSVPANGTYVAGENLDFTVNFDESVTVDTTGGTPRIALVIGSSSVYATYLSGSGTSSLVFRATITAGNLDTNGITLGALSLDGGTIKDAATNNAALTLNSIASTSGVLVDAVAPIVSSSNRQTPAGSIINATSAVFRVTFSKPVTGVDASDFTLTATSSAAGTISSVSAVSALVYDVTVSSLSGNGTLRLDLNSSSTGIADTASNPIAGGFTSGQTYTLDHLAPTVTSIVRQTPSAVNTSASSVTFRVSFSESVSGVDATAFDLTTLSGSAAGTITAVSPVSGSVYDVTVGTLSGLGTLRLDAIAFGSTVIDSGGNILTADFTSGDVYAIGATDVFNFTGLAQSSTHSVSRQLDLQAAQRFTTGPSAPLTVFDLAAMVVTANSANPVVTINKDDNGLIGDPVGTLTNPSVLTANSLNVWTGDISLDANTTYWVVFRETSATGAYSISYTNATTGGLGSWATANDYDFEYYSSSTWAPHAGGLDIDIGAVTAASSAGITLPASGTYVTGQNLDITMNFSGPVTVTGVPVLVLTVGSTTQYATYVSGSGTHALVFRYTVQTGDTDADGITVNSIALNGGTIADANGIDAMLSFTPATASGVVVAAAPTSRLLNLSSRGQVGTGQNVLIAGFIITGTESKHVVLRGVGPALSGFGVQGGLAHPTIKLYDGGQNLLMSNSGWANDPAISTAFTAVGAVPFAADSADAALVATLAPGGYTLVVSGQNETTGVALAEVYDASPSASEPRQKLINIAGRGFVGTGENVLIGGFIISGDAPKRVLVRAIGPGLAKSGLSSVLTDPVLELHDATSVIAHNDNWETQENSSNGNVSAATAAVNAPSLDAGSKDAAVVMTLAPGAYTAIVSGNSGATGVALLEIYEIPQ